MSQIGEWVLRKLCRPLPPDVNPCDLLESDDLLARFRESFNQPIDPWLTGRILETASGNGVLAAQVRDRGVGRVTALDRWVEFPRRVRRYVADTRGLDLVRSDAAQLPFADGTFDTVLSQDGFEHFVDPRRALDETARVLRRGGTLLVTFGPPWLSPRGGHMMFLRPPPWFHLIFSERTIFAVRAEYRSDGVRGWTEGYSPISKLTLARFQQCARAAGLVPLAETIDPVGGLKILTRIPGVREFFCSVYGGIWQKPSAKEVQ